MRQRLWTSGQELYQNAARNTVEFASEGWNWRSVTEDENMLRHTISGELIHPVHLHNAMQLAQQQQAAAQAAADNGNEEQNQQHQQNFMAHLPLERNDGPRSSTIKAATATATAAAAHAAVSHVDTSIGRPLAQPPASPTPTATA